MSAQSSKGARGDGEPARSLGHSTPTQQARLAAIAAAILCYIVFAVVLTWPFALHPQSTLTAPIGFDVTSSVGKFHALAAEHTSPFTGGRLRTIGYPDGVAKTPALDRASALSSAALWLGSVTIGAIAAHGYETLLGLVLTASVAFLFVLWATNSASAGFVAGVAYGFFPHIVTLTRAAPTYTHMWLYLLPLWALTALVLRPTRRRALVAGASALPALFWTPYYAEHVLVLTLATAVLASALIWRFFDRERSLRTLAWVCLPLAIGVFAYLMIAIHGGTKEVPTREAADAYVESAHPLMYVVPGNFSTWRKTAWGDGLHSWLVRMVPRAEGVDLYLGWSVLLLATIGVIWSMMQLRAPPKVGRQSAAIAGALAAVAAGAAFACSGPPTIGIRMAGLNVPTPSYLLTHAVPALRAGQRFVMPLMGGVSCLAGIGVAVLLRRRSALASGAIGVAIAVAVAADLKTDVPSLATRIPHSPALARLSRAPRAPAIEYFPQGLLTGEVTAPCLWQIQHKMPLVNTCSTTYFSPLVVQVSDPTTCSNLGVLGHVGVRYVVSYTGYPPFKGCPDRVHALHVLARDKLFTVESLTTPPQPLAAFLTGFGAKEPSGFRWLVSRTGTIEVEGPCSPCRGTLTMRLASFAHPRVVQIVDSRRQLLVVTVPTGEKRIQIPLRFDRRILLRVIVTPGPESIAAATGSNDPRAVAVAFSEPVFNQMQRFPIARQR